jgi:hypothetical protein
MQQESRDERGVLCDGGAAIIVHQKNECPQQGVAGIG